MEAMGELAAVGAMRRRQLSVATFEPPPMPNRGLRSISAFDSVPLAPDPIVSDPAVPDGGVSGAVAASLELVGAARTTAPAELALSGFADAADFADRVEELARTVEYLQVLAAAAVDRTRHEAAADTGSRNGWTTGWGHETADPGAAGSSGFAVPGRDGCRNTAEFLRARLRISAAEARRRLALAASLLPSTGITGQPVPPAREELATALAAGTIPSRAATIITLALERAQPITDPDTLARMEHALTRTAAEQDQDFLTRITRRWADAIDQDGA